MRTPQDIVDKLNALLMAEGSRLKGTPTLPLHEDTVRETMDALNSSLSRLRALEAALRERGALLTADEVMAETEEVASGMVGKALRMVYEGRGRDPKREKGTIAQVVLRDLALEPVQMFRRQVAKDEAPIRKRARAALQEGRDRG